MPCTSTIDAVTLEFNGGTVKWEVAFRQIGGSPVIVYELDPSVWNCLGENTMTIQAGSDTGACTGWPSTLSVIPYDF